uniref:Guanylate cyclase domain-containing protein n=1 Tax=Angiostrongylus cantonensis TaxID=6313 RepID=A0A0K0D2U7_ANGCA
MLQTATSVCTSGELKEESRDLARQIAISNGYEIVTPRDKFRGRATLKKQRFGQNKVSFILPFISDEISAAMKRCLRTADLEESVAIIEIQPNTLRRQLVRNRPYDRLCETQNCVICLYGRDGDCMSSATIYMISCGACEYWNKGDESALVRDTKTPTRKLLEAFWINAKNPTMEWQGGMSRDHSLSRPLPSHRSLTEGAAVVSHMRL